MIKFICCINLIISLYSFFTLIRVRKFLIEIRKSNKDNIELIESNKIVIVIPVLREQNCIEETIDHFCKITKNIPIIIVTTQKEVYEYKNKNVITTQDIVKNKILPKYKNVYWINYPKTKGYMANQLNYVIDNLENLKLFKNIDYNNIYLALYNADSRPNKNTFSEIIKKVNNNNLVIQQYSYCFANYNSLNSVLKGFSIYQSNFEFKTGLINTFFKSKYLYTHVVGHGLIINLKLLKKLGNFNTKFWCEDVYMSMQLKFENLNITPILTLENIETPENLKSLIKQNSVWFNTTWKYKKIYNDIRKKEKFNINGLIGCLNEFRCATNWLFFPILILFDILVPLIYKNYLLLIFSIITYCIYIFINLSITIKIINTLDNKKYKISLYKFYCLFIATLLSNLGPIYSLVNKSKTKYKTER